MLEHHNIAYCVMSGAQLPCVLRATAAIRVRSPARSRPTPPLRGFLLERGPDVVGRPGCANGTLRARTCSPTSTTTDTATRYATPSHSGSCQAPERCRRSGSGTQPHPISGLQRGGLQSWVQLFELREVDPGPDGDRAERVAGLHRPKAWPERLGARRSRMQPRFSRCPGTRLSGSVWGWDASSRSTLRPVFSEIARRCRRDAPSSRKGGSGRRVAGSRRARARARATRRARDNDNDGGHDTVASAAGPR